MSEQELALTKEEAVEEFAEKCFSTLYQWSAEGGNTETRPDMDIKDEETRKIAQLISTASKHWRMKVEDVLEKIRDFKVVHRDQIPSDSPLMELFKQIDSIALRRD